ncbi:hypothetical protein L6452_15269 [Arctium lappa]|uniref:Uncharacterized protein n=1 Tax=Arctium lappa TaxID=4217 RepID=A0ACB9CN83_ARCLA|nr:hypothetical protein L6452_15269 [Arctium lappa]
MKTAFLSLRQRLHTSYPCQLYWVHLITGFPARHVGSLWFGLELSSLVYMEIRSCTGLLLLAMGRRC